MFAPPLAKAAANCLHLDKELFKKVIKVYALRVPAVEVGKLRQQLAAEQKILKAPRVKTVVADEGDPSKRLLLLSERLAGAVEYDLHLDYAHWTADEILAAVLPDGVPAPSSFEQVGHLIHLNLLPVHAPYKHVIAEVIMSKNPSCRTLINKTSPIHAAFRTFDMEVLAGDDDTVVTIRESGCTFVFDYAKVYWNSRLQHEHERLVREFFQKGQRICDMFSGVGPFALPAAKQGCRVYANDLNPESHRYLVANATRNRISDNDQHSSFMLPHNMDARAFVRKVFGEEGILFDHVVMNLPAMAHEFLDVFRDEPTNPMVHCYVFVKASEDEAAEQRAKELCESVLQRSIEPERVHFVRNVAPKKDMYCVSFYLHGNGKRRKTK